MKEIVVKCDLCGVTMTEKSDCCTDGVDICHACSNVIMRMVDRTDYVDVDRLSSLISQPLFFDTIKSMLAKACEERTKHRRVVGNGDGKLIIDGPLAGGTE